MRQLLAGISIALLMITAKITGRTRHLLRAIDTDAAAARRAHFFDRFLGIIFIHSLLRPSLSSDMNRIFVFVVFFFSQSGRRWLIHNEHGHTKYAVPVHGVIDVKWHRHDSKKMAGKWANFQKIAGFCCPLGMGGGRNDVKPKKILAASDPSGQKNTRPGVANVVKKSKKFQRHPISPPPQPLGY